MTPEQEQEIYRLAGDNSPLLDYSRDALRALLEDLGRVEGIADYWHTEHNKMLDLLIAHKRQLEKVTAEKIIVGSIVNGAVESSEG